MKKQIASAFDEIKAEQQLKTDTKYFIYEFYNKKEATNHKPRKKLILAPLCVVLVVILTAGVLTSTIPVSAVSFDIENTSIELELNRLNKVVKVNCFGEENVFSQLKLKNLDCEKAVSLIIERVKSQNADISSASLTVNCKSTEKAEKISDTISNKATQDIPISCHSAHKELRNEAHAHGISTGKYQAYIILKEYESDLSIEDIRNISISELKSKISSHTESEKEEVIIQPQQNAHCESTDAGNGKHHGRNK